MATTKPFPQAGFLSRLQLLVDAGEALPASLLTPRLGPILLAPDGSGAPSGAAVDLVQLLQARAAMHAAALDTALATDDLRRYQKFARPGQPSAHIVQLRQRQAAARQATNQSRQAFNKAAAAFVREAAIKVPERVALEAYMAQWIDVNVPVDPGAAG